MSSADRQLSIEFECRTEILKENLTDRTKQLPLEVSENWLSLDKRFELSFNPDVTATVTKADSTILIDITKEAV
jgi:predicted membrane-bound dolichyl-phosphate-mannose-protein mannosyltransferase